MDYDPSESPLVKLLLNGKNYRMAKGQMVQVFDERMMLNVVRSGYIKRYLITDDGSQSVQSVYGPGDIFPLTPVYKSLFNRNIYRGEELFYYETITDASVCSISEATLRGAVLENTNIYRDLLYVSGERLSSNIQRLENMALRSAHSRVANQLAYYADKFGKKTSEGTAISLPLTHQTLANILNLARETVTHSLVRLHEKGLIKVNKTITVIDVDKLRREAH
jgi:CRP/FNR family transcriptional regulator